jgi:hypothetical protein
MRKLLPLFAALFFAVSAAAQYTTVTAIHIQDTGGTLLASGQLCFQGVDANDVPLPGYKASNGQVVKSPTCFQITNGVIPGGSKVPDTALTVPVNVCLRATVRDTKKQEILHYKCPQPTGGTWSFDSYDPNLTPQVPVTAGPTGPAGPTGATGATGAVTCSPGPCGTGGDFVVSGALTAQKMAEMRIASKFAGATVADKIDAACSDFSGTTGVILKTSDLGDGRSFGLLHNCTLIDMTGNRQPDLGGSLAEWRGGFATQARWTLNQPGIQNLAGFHLFAEAFTGGHNGIPYGGDTSKANYVGFELKLNKRTAGQATALNTEIQCTGIGDCFGNSAVNWCWGGLIVGVGDEGCVGGGARVLYGDSNGVTVPSVFKGTVTVVGVDGITLTLNTAVNTFSLGENRILRITTPAKIYSTGTVTVTSGGVSAVGSGTSWLSLCPGGVTCSYALPTTRLFLSLDHYDLTSGGNTASWVVPICTITDNTHLTLCGDKTAVLTGVVRAGASAIYSYSSSTGTPFTVGEKVTTSGFVIGGNNGTCTISSVVAGTSFTCSAVAQANETHAGSALAAYGSGAYTGDYNASGEAYKIYKGGMVSTLLTPAPWQASSGQLQVGNISDFAVTDTVDEPVQWNWQGTASTFACLQSVGPAACNGILISNIINKSAGIGQIINGNWQLGIVFENQTAGQMLAGMTFITPPAVFASIGDSGTTGAVDLFQMFKRGGGLGNLYWQFTDGTYNNYWNFSGGGSTATIDSANGGGTFGIGPSGGWGVGYALAASAYPNYTDAFMSIPVNNTDSRILTSQFGGNYYYGFNHANAMFGEGLKLQGGTGSIGQHTASIGSPTWQIDGSNGNASFNGSTTLGSGTPITKHLSATATLDFASITAPACAADLTITVTGAAVGDTVNLGAPNASVAAGVQFFGWVSASNTVSVRACAFSGTPDPASGTFRADVWKH